ncbi:hypothetical protein IQ276_003055 [Desmonostoc muscorum LEGE 12446]|nr:hypothetical protein [Desmonostoc muscorum]MCF2145447.1 hypothetical protein [Desmonostoc muscorum LEGE 12446]
MLGEAIDQLVESELGLLGAIINGADIVVSLPAPTFSSESEVEAENVEESEEVSAGATKT